MEAGALSPRLLVPFFFFNIYHCFVVLALKISLCPENTFKGQREEEKVTEEIETLTSRKEK